VIRRLPAAVVGALVLTLAVPGAAAARLQLIFPLAANDAGLRSFATAVSTPGSPEYGRYQPVATLARRFGASVRSRTAVVRYLRAIGAQAVQVNPTGMFVQATMSVGLAERTFGTSLVRPSSAAHSQFLAPRFAPRLPRALRAITLGVVGLDTRPLFKPRPATQPPSDYRTVSGAPTGCPEGVATHGFTPNQYLTAYDYAPLHDAGLRGQGQRVAAIEIDGFKRSDLTTFARCFGFRVPPIHIYGVGTSKPLAPGPEATLDLELLGAAAPRARSLEVFESRSDAVAVDQAFAAPLLQPGAKPQVISASLGLCEPAMDQAFGSAGILSVERSLQLAAATGITTVVASGDTGSADCADPQGTPVDALAVDYPSGSPWVTSVGGTNLSLDPSNRIAAQAVWNDTTDQLAAGGGGLSLLFYRPPYQKGVVAPNRRAVPDLAMLADIGPGYAIFCSAHQPGCRGWRTVGGTSAAAPLVAGGMALVDQDLARRHREPVGLANPLLYRLGRSTASAGVFLDVTQGGNDLGPFIPGGDGQPLGCCSANPGFDWATGWGSLDLAHFDQAATTLLPRIADVSLGVPSPQHPVANRELVVTLSCSRRCTALAFGFVEVKGKPTIDLESARYHFQSRGAKRVVIHFSAHQEAELRAALAGHRRITAELFGAAVDRAGKLGRVTSGKAFRIGG
jgi:kumamolisin